MRISDWSSDVCSSDLGTGGEALIIDPVKEHCEAYATLLRELDIRLLHAVDTHTHADHITALGDLRDSTGCATVMGAHSKADCVSRSITEGEVLRVGEIVLQAMYPSGHTDESFSFVLTPCRPLSLFPLDLLLIPGERT